MLSQVRSQGKKSCDFKLLGNNSLVSCTVTANALGYYLASVTDVTLNHLFVLVGDLHIRIHAETALLLPGDLHSLMLTVAADRHLSLPFFAFSH